MKNNLNDSIKSLEIKMKKKSKQESIAAFQAGIDAREAGQTQAAQRLLLSALTSHPEPWKVCFQLSLTELEPFQALEWLLKATEYSNCGFVALIRATELSIQANAIVQAEKLLQRAVSYPQKNIFRAHIAAGLLAQEKQQFKLAVGSFLKALEVSPDKFVAYKSCAIAMGELYHKNAMTSDRKSLNLQVSPLALLERWLSSQIGVSLTDMAKKFNQLGISYYVVSPGGNGIGDRLVSANISAKLMEILGLKFIGIDKNVITGKSGRSDWWNTNQDKPGLYENIGLTRLPQIETRSKGGKKKVVEYAPPNDGNLLAWFQGLNNVLDECRLSDSLVVEKTMVKVVIDTNIYGMLSPFLWDDVGDCMENGFHDAFMKVRETFIEEKKFDLLWHLRLGDEANIHNIIPNGVFTPYRFERTGEVFTRDSLKKLKYMIRYDKIKEFSEFSQKLKKLIPGIKMGLISDGYDFSFEFIKNRESLHKRLEKYGLDIKKLDLDSLKRECQDSFFAAFSHMDEIIYGESYDSFDKSVKAIASTPTIITSNGIFASNLVNNCSNNKQAVFLFSRERGQAPRKGVDFYHVNIDNFAKKLSAYLKSKQTGSPCIIHLGMPKPAVVRYSAHYLTIWKIVIFII